MTCVVDISTLDTGTPFTVGLLPRFRPISARVFHTVFSTTHIAASCIVPLWGISSPALTTENLYFLQKEKSISPVEGYHFYKTSTFVFELFYPSSGSFCQPNTSSSLESSCVAHHG
ncbi:hypothetical protein LDENG_00001550 [Lucifuga dentata]|nr:hypothetical protein LDENG_00001550 [Lucifuga dentata]